MRWIPDRYQGYDDLSIREVDEVEVEVADIED